MALHSSNVETSSRSVLLRARICVRVWQAGRDTQLTIWKESSPFNINWLKSLCDASNMLPWLWSAIAPAICCQRGPWPRLRSGRTSKAARHCRLRLDPSFCCFALLILRHFSSLRVDQHMQSISHVSPGFSSKCRVCTGRIWQRERLI
jgi:hypothetical protein